MALQQMEVLEALALELHQEVKRHGVAKALKFFFSRVLPARRRGSNLAAQHQADVDKPLSLFLVVCEKTNLLSALAVLHLARFMLLHVDVLNARRDFGCTLKLLDDKVRVRFLQYAVDSKKWVLTMLILRNKRCMQAPSVLDTLVKKFHSVPESHLPTKILLARGGLKKEILIGIVTFLIRVENKALLEFVVKKNLISLSEVTITLPLDGPTQRTVVLSALSIIAQSLTMARREAGKELNGMLHLAVESGLSTYHAALTETHGIGHVESPVRLAIRHRRLDVLRLLYRTGAAHNAELCKANTMLGLILQSSEDLERVDPDLLVIDTEVVRIFRYVRCAARQPRRLQDLCMLRLSHSLGCRDPRARTQALERLVRNVKQRGTPGSEMTKFALNNKVLFKDVLLDFITGTAYNAKDRDPPGVW